MDIWDNAIRTFGMYFVVFIVIRLMGKREIGKLSVFDMVISIMVAEIAVIVIEDTNRPFIDGITPMAVLVAVQVFLAFITLKSRKLRLWFDGKPTILIERGKLNRDAMRKQRYNLDDLLLQLRENKLPTVADVEFAVLETTGKLSIFPKDKKKSTGHHEGEPVPGTIAQTPLAKPFPKNYRFESLPVPLIMDGKIVEDNIQMIGKDRFWLNTQLKQRGIQDAKQVFLCTIDHRGKVFIDPMRRPRT
ncbi:uncharacterized membrane protein YcaP (DUF421 family) [Paenibacillus methanolicus]|uniref:Uncharacterized membrane protein YcaP (DUF421 family) n=2 Tax=Paenibacillus methanolicus TaxID=582686 RepID=A0A5S5C3C0_9BACL|nr:uncharacterized membrane protein YcaP (DUF421 family) [Paenibacillus methanolicus]